MFYEVNSVNRDGINSTGINSTGELHLRTAEDQLRRPREFILPWKFIPD